MQKSSVFPSALLKYIVLALLLAGISIFATPSTANAQQPASSGTKPIANGLFTASSAHLPDETDTTVMRSRAVTIDFDAFTMLSRSGKSERLVLNLFEDAIYVATMERIENNASGGFTWVGQLEGVDYSLVTLAVNKDVMIGKVAWLEGLYEIRYVSDDVHKIVEINPAAFGEELPPIDVVYPEVEPTAPAMLSAFDDGSVIDVLVVYSPEARMAAGSTTAIENTIILAVSETNSAYANSNIDQRLNLVHMEEVTGAANDFYVDLDAIRSKTDGIMEIAHTLRDTYHADNVALIIEDNALCGLAYRMATVSTSFEADAFSVTSRNCAVGNLSFAHELGHNMSAHHDWYVTTATTPWTYVHGYVNLADNWRTIMAYTNECSANSQSCPKIPYFSNPAESWDGDPIGVLAGTRSNCLLNTSYAPGSECDADVHLALNNTAATTDQFRTSQYTWIGNTTDWNTDTNWTTQEGVPGSTTTVNRVPRTIDDVVIPSAPAGGNWPTLSSGTANVRDVIIETGAQLTLSGGTLYVYGNWTEQGTGKLIATGGEVIFAGVLDVEVTTSADSHFPETTFGDGSTKEITLNSTVDIDSDVTFAVGATTMPGSNMIEVAGNWNDGGGFSAESSFVVLDGVTQDISKPTTVTTLLSEDFSVYDGTTCCTTSVPFGWAREHTVGFGWATGDYGDGHGGIARLWTDSADGWLFTSAVKLKPDVTYTLSYDNRVRLGSETVTFSFHIGSAQSSASMTQLVSSTTSNSMSYATKTDTFTVSTAGTYYLGIRAQQSGTSDSGFVDNILLTDLQNLTFYDLQVGSSSDAMLLDGDAKVQNDLTVDANSVFDLASHNVTVEGTVINNGTLKQSATANSPDTTEYLRIQDKTGSTDKYRGLSITPIGNMGDTTVQIWGNQDCADAGVAAGTQVSNAIQRCYDIVPTTPQSAEITFYYRSAEANGNDTPYAFHYLGSADNWESELFSARDTGSAEASYVTATGIDNYSPFALGNALNFVTTIIDVTSGTAANDGTIGSTEYVGYSTGINSGFGNIIGSNSKLHFDSDSSGALNIGVEAGGAIVSPNTAIIYIDTDNGATGFSSTSGFTDTGDECRRGISGWDGTNRSQINFAPGFAANYAICVDNSFAGLWQLVNGGSHTFVTSVNRTTVAANHYELDLTLANLGLSAGDAFNYIATYLNGSNAFRSDEFHGVAAYAGGNPGYSTVPLGAGAYNRFVSYEPTLVINEIMYDPSVSGDTNGEWFEIYNTSTNPIDLDGWTIKDNSGSFNISGSLVVAPNGYAVLCRNDDAMVNGGVTCDLEYSSLALSNSGDEVVLEAPNGSEVDRVTYDDGPNFPDAQDESLCLTDPAADNNVGSNWRTSTAVYGDGDLGTPGEFNYDCFDSAFLNGGTGPGGIGENDGTSALNVWLKANAGTSTTTDGAGVNTWADQSGNDYDAVQATEANQPRFEGSELLNGNPTVRFEGGTNNATISDYFDLPAGVIQGVSDFTVFSVIDWNGGSVWQRVWDFGNGTTNAYGFLTASAGGTNKPRFAIKPSPPNEDPQLNWSTALPTNSGQLLGMRWPASGTAQAYLNGTSSGSVGVASTPTDLGPISHNFIGRSIFSADPYLNSDMAEFIVYSSALPSSERIIVENYLSAKYNIAVANDRYDGDTTANGDFDFNVAGIGRESDGTHSLSHGGGIIVSDVSFLNDNGDYMLFGRQTTDCSPVTTELPTGGDWDGVNDERWGCSYYFDVTDVGATTGSGTVDIAFDFSESGTNGAPEAPTSNYAFLKRIAATGDFTDETANCVTGGTYLSEDRVIFTGVLVSCLGSNFTLGSKDSEESPTLIELASFTATLVNGAVELEWITSAEYDNAGFNLYRSTNASGIDLTQVNSEFIASQSVLGGGATYAYQDNPGSGTWYYWLEDLDYVGTTTLHGPVELVVSAPTSVQATTFVGSNSSIVLLLAASAVVLIVFGIVGATARRRATLR